MKLNEIKDAALKNEFNRIAAKVLEESKKFSLTATPSVFIEYTPSTYTNIQDLQTYIRNYVASYIEDYNKSYVIEVVNQRLIRIGHR